MPVRSNVDLCLFIRLVSVARERILESEIADLLESDDPERAMRVWRSRFEASRTTLFHEGYHYWQGLRLPFLHWYATFAFRESLSQMKQFAGTGLPFEQWNAIVPAFHYLGERLACFYLGKSRFQIQMPTAKPPGEPLVSALLSPIDLLEGATSVAEWQSITDLPTDVKQFIRWTKRNPAYTDAFDFVSGVLKSEELALRCFNPLIEKAFATNRPLRAFLELLGLLERHLTRPDVQAFIGQKEPCRWLDLFEAFLEDIPFEKGPDSMRDIAADQAYCRVTLSNWVNATWPDHSPLHPFLSTNAQEWLKNEERHPEYGLLLSQLPWAKKLALSSMEGEFYPPLTILRFQVNEKENRVIHVGYVEKFVLVPGGRAPLIDLLTMFSIVRRATGSHFDTDLRLCHHVACPHYNANYCNLYPVIPKTWEQCKFPQLAESLTQVAANTTLGGNVGDFFSRNKNRGRR